MSVAGVCGAGSWAAVQLAAESVQSASQAASGAPSQAVEPAAAEGEGGSGCVRRTDGGGETRAHEGRHGHRGHHVQHGRHGHHGRHGGGLVQAIRQVLEQLVAEAAADSVAVDTADPATSDLVAVDTEATETVEDPMEPAAGEPATTAVVQTADSGGDGAPASRFAVKHALYAFLHTLFSTIAQGHAMPPAPDATDGEGGAAAAPAPLAPTAGYRNAGMGLEGLMSGLASEGTAGMDLTALQATFDHLVGTVGGEAAVGTVTLQSFLEALLAHLGGSAPAADPVPPTGGLVAVTA